jgi:hypothetical protein
VLLMVFLDDSSEAPLPTAYTLAELDDKVRRFLFSPSAAF